MDKQMEEWRAQIKEILARHTDDAFFLRWAAIRLSMLERAVYSKK